MTTLSAAEEKRSFGLRALYALLTGVGVTAAGALFGFAGGAFEGYTGLVRPAYTPPDALFPIVWSVLYFVMGIALYLTFSAVPDSRDRGVARFVALALFFVQLAVNLVWPAIFFRADMYYFAFLWLALLDALTLALVIIETRVDRTAAILLIPYLLWLLFATWLNIMIAVYN